MEEKINFDKWTAEDEALVQVGFASISPDARLTEAVREKARTRLERPRGFLSFIRRHKAPAITLASVCVLLLVFFALSDNRVYYGDGMGAAANEQMATPAASPVAGAAGDYYDEKGYAYVEDSYAYNDSDYLVSEESSREVIVPPIDPPLPPETAGVIDTNNLKIIYTVDATLRVKDLDASIQAIKSRATALGGYVAESSLSGVENSESAYIRLKIPSQALTAFTESMPEWGTVQNSRTYSNDVTEEYFDADTRLNTLKTMEERYLEFFAQAETVEEMLMIEDSLTELRLEKEVLEGRLRFWDNRVNFSDVSISLYPITTDILITDPWEPVSFSSTMRAAQNAVVKTISRAWNGFNNLIIGFAYALPVLLVLLVIFLLIRWRLKRRRARQQAEAKSDLS
jgi:hypothetical protein